MNAIVEKKVENFIKKEINSKLSNVLLLKDSTLNEYFLFNKYFVKEVSKNLYEVFFTYSDKKYTFKSLKNAFCFCVFDKANKFTDSIKIQHLDMSLSSIDISIYQLKKILKKTKDFDQKMIFIAKLNNKLLRKKRIQGQLEYYINTANFWQYNKYREENTIK